MSLLEYVNSKDKSVLPEVLNINEVYKLLSGIDECWAIRPVLGELSVTHSRIRSITISPRYQDAGFLLENTAFVESIYTNELACRLALSKLINATNEKNEARILELQTKGDTE